MARDHCCDENLQCTFTMVPYSNKEVYRTIQFTRKLTILNTKLPYFTNKIFFKKEEAIKSFKYLNILNLYY